MDLHHDSAGVEVAQDRFRFDEIARRVGDAVLGVLNKDESISGFVIGIEGAWGSGKSTIINYIRSHLSRQKEVDLRIISFDPWWLNSEADIQSGLLASISANLPATGSKQTLQLLSKLTKAAGAVPPSVDELLKLSKRTESLVGFLAAARSAGGDASKLLSASKSPRDLRGELAAELQKHKLRFVVVIDDLDRLGPSKAVDVLSALRQVGDLPNFVYLVAYDPEAVRNILGSFQPPLSNDFLEKIINITITVPPITGGQMTDFLDSLIIEQALTPLTASPPHLEALVRLLDTPREVVRLANSVSFWSGSKLQEVYAPDFVLLEALRLKSSRVYSGLLRTSDIWLNTPTSMFSSLTHPTDEENERVAERVDRELALTQSDADSRLRSALGVLFPDAAVYLRTSSASGTKTPPRAIRQPEDFFTYFFHLPLPGAPSEADVSAVVRVDSEPYHSTEIVRGFALKTSTDVRPFDVLVSQVERRLDGATRDQKLKVVRSFLEAGDAISRSPGVVGSFGGSFDSARYLVARLLKSIETLGAEDVRTLARSAADVSTLAALQLTVSVGTPFYLLDDQDRETLITLDPAAQEQLKNETLDKIGDAVDDGSILQSPMMPRLVYMARKGDRPDIVERFQSHLQDSAWFLGVIAAYRGYANARSAAMELLGLDAEEFDQRLALAINSDVGADVKEYARELLQGRD